MARKSICVTLSICEDANRATPSMQHFAFAFFFCFLKSPQRTKDSPGLYSTRGCEAVPRHETGANGGDCVTQGPYHRLGSAIRERATQIDSWDVKEREEE